VVAVPVVAEAVAETIAATMLLLCLQAAWPVAAALISLQALKPQKVVPAQQPVEVKAAQVKAAQAMAARAVIMVMQDHRL
jgi:hypothetical protein